MDSFVPFFFFFNFFFLKFIDELKFRYRNLLDENGLWMWRASFDVNREESDLNMKSTSITPPQVFARCHNCNQSFSLTSSSKDRLQINVRNKENVPFPKIFLIAFIFISKRSLFAPNVKEDCQIAHYVYCL